MQEKYISLQNTKLDYKITGEGLPVVLIHGFAEDSSIWDNQVEYLKNDYQLIIPDLPGSGASGMINTLVSEGEGLGVRPIGMEDYAECIKHILDEEKIGKCIMIGHSKGGYITLAFAEKYPASLISFGLFHSSAYADDDAKVEIRKKAIGFIETNGTEAFLKTSIPGLFYDRGNSNQPDALIEEKHSSGHLSERSLKSDSQEVTSRVDASSGHLFERSPESDSQEVARRVDASRGHLFERSPKSDSQEVARRIDALLEKGKAFSPKALIQYYNAMIARPDRTNILKNNNSPVLFIMGEHDKAVPFKHSLAQSYMPFQSYIHILRNSAHMGMLEEPERANEILANFLLYLQANNYGRTALLSILQSNK